MKHKIQWFETGFEKQKEKKKKKKKKEDICYGKFK